ncbi:uncharacterized protein LOC116299936 [Actinia tenebrosa]|uniref:Uncharacterized protein LOC116299936 n=1 Tax=Actinia tenebrosa TaxID=6105 RepID=A0A6P8I7G8_ACTTE|nr:uncharacterized protein LOC116299936 [Actinia tenebrosa]
MYVKKDDDKVKALRAAEQKTDENKKKLNSFTEELDGIQNGHLQKDLIEKAVTKISKQIQGIEENLMKILESLDSLSLGSATLGVKGKRKSVVKWIQDLITEADSQRARCEALQKGQDL